MPRLPVLTWAELIESDDKPFGRLAMTDSPVSVSAYGLCHCDDAVTDILLARHFVGQRHVARWAAQLGDIDSGPVDVGGSS